MNIIRHKNQLKILFLNSFVGNVVFIDSFHSIRLNTARDAVQVTMTFLNQNQLSFIAFRKHLNKKKVIKLRRRKK